MSAVNKYKEITVVEHLYIHLLFHSVECAKNTKNKGIWREDVERLDERHKKFEVEDAEVRCQIK